MRRFEKPGGGKMNTDHIYKRKYLEGTEDCRVRSAKGQ